MARFVALRFGRLGKSWHVRSWLVMAWQAWHGWDRFGRDGRGVARFGWQGEAGLDAASRGPVWQAGFCFLLRSLK